METRKCSSCGDTKPIDEFWVKPKGRKSGMCKPCKREYNTTWYKKNKKRHIQNVVKNNTRYRQELKDFTNEKKSVPCKDCGRTFPPEAMDFDHLNASLKIGNVAKMVANAVPLQKVKEEIEKCDVVCATCHRIRTAARRTVFGVSLEETPPS